MTKRYFLGAERFAVRRSWALLACALSVLSTGMWASAAETTGANEGYSVTLQHWGAITR
ncbi:Cyclic di-GMP binding protein [Pseudomonas amygdali pv. ulmi]|uniref:Cyclic di-GMP binding protein n=1 Tax=Pseudomonas amygdali pv. ulmi TaxID=251720 RepID=A0A0Q0J453_PSEA0|nr:hypothetical protein [Pseudomonas amygdali]KPZ08419.1 Cyclic di-GMP binding protein [Pseudomonas amygdali pv. ulmi]